MKRARFRKAGAILRRGLAFALIWWILAEERTDSWSVGLFAVALALAADLLLSPPGRGRLAVAGLLEFAGFFLVQSVKGGAQVAARALRPRLDLAPVLMEIPVTLPPGHPRVILISTLNLLPGTLSVQLDNDVLLLHVLDRRLPIEAEVREAEARIARMLEIEP